MKTSNPLESLNNILSLRAAAKESGPKTFLHTSAANNGKLLITFLQCHYDGKRYVSTEEIAAFANQSRANVLRYLTGLWLGGIIKRKTLPRSGKIGRKMLGWSAKP